MLFTPSNVIRVLLNVKPNKFVHEQLGLGLLNVNIRHATSRNLGLLRSHCVSTSLSSISRNNDKKVRYYHLTTQEEIPKLEEWDIIISGGGLVGSAMACALGQLHMLEDKKILLLEGGPTRDFTPLSESYSNRVSALTPGTRLFFEDLGIWQTICSLRMKPVKKMQVWESCSNAAIALQHKALAEDVAYIVENDVIIRSITQQLKITGNVEIWHGVKVASYQLPRNPHSDDVSDLSQLTLEDGRCLTTKLLIAADGMNSLVRKTMGVKYISWNYNQKAIVGNLKFFEPTDNNVAWQRFLPSGPVALLPLSDNQSSLVWTVTPKMADQLMEMTDDTFTDVLNTALWQEKRSNPIVDTVTSTVDTILSTFFCSKGPMKQLPPSIMTVEPNSRACFPLGLGHATSYVMPRVALIGDAAHRVHPLAGQGVNLGFGDAKCLAQLINKSLMDGYSLGYLPTLYEYESERQKQNVPVMAAIEGLHRLYTTEFLPVVLLRSVGVQLTEACIPLKNQIMAGASS